MLHRDVTEQTSIEDTIALLKQPPDDWPAKWEGFPNIEEAFRRILQEALTHTPLRRIRNRSPGCRG